MFPEMEGKGACKKIFISSKMLWKYPGKKKITLNIQDFNIKAIFENTPEEYTWTR